MVAMIPIQSESVPANLFSRSEQLADFHFAEWFWQFLS
jgi:hypothetical protein